MIQISQFNNYAIKLENGHEIYVHFSSKFLTQMCFEAINTFVSEGKRFTPFVQLIADGHAREILVDSNRIVSIIPNCEFKFTPD